MTNFCLAIRFLHSLLGVICYSMIAPGAPLAPTSPRTRGEVEQVACACPTHHAVVISATLSPRRLRVLGDAPGADHAHVIVHETAGVGSVAHLDEGGELMVHVEHAA